MRCGAVLWCTVPYCTVLCGAVVWCTVWCCGVVYRTVLHCTVWCWTELAALYCTALCFSVLYLLHCVAAVATDTYIDTVVYVGVVFILICPAGSVMSRHSVLLAYASVPSYYELCFTDTIFLTHPALFFPTLLYRLALRYVLSLRLRITLR